MKRQISALINFGKRNLIDTLILILLALSIWAILSIGIKIIPLIPTSLNVDLQNDLNSIYLNLSYSYIAGLVIYWFTVILPKRGRKKVYIPLINNLISNYYSSSLLVFYLFYYKNESIVDLNKHEIAIRFFKNELKSDIKIIKKIIEKENKDTFLKRSKEEFREFNKSIIPNEEYLTERQLSIINKIRQGQFIRRMDVYRDFYGWHDTESSFYEEFNMYVTLIDELKNM